MLKFLRGLSPQEELLKEDEHPFPDALLFMRSVFTSAADFQRVRMHFLDEHNRLYDRVPRENSAQYMVQFLHSAAEKIKDALHAQTQEAKCEAFSESLAHFFFAIRELIMREDFDIPPSYDQRLKTQIIMFRDNVQAFAGPRADFKHLCREISNVIADARKLDRLNSSKFRFLSDAAYDLRKSNPFLHIMHPHTFKAPAAAA